MDFAHHYTRTGLHPIASLLKRLRKAASPDGMNAAGRGVARKSAARKSAARKSTARKSTARKSAARKAR